MSVEPVKQQVIDRLAERWAKARRSPANCRLGPEARRRRGGACSACTPPQEFELDREVAQLINTAVFQRAGIGMCPYYVVASHLVAGLTLGPEAFRSRSVGKDRVDPVVEIKGALRRVRNVRRASHLSPEDIEALALSDKHDRWNALYSVLSAERALENALAMFQARKPAKTGRKPRGRTGALHIQAVARAMAGAWRTLTGRLPGRANLEFHGLLNAATGTIFGYPAEEPDWESATRTALERINEDAASRS
jgi:hypothetical protein